MKKHTKYIYFIILIFSSNVTFSQTHTTLGNKKLFDKIIQKLEDNIEKNYYIDSIQPIKYNEYIYVDSSKHLLSAVYIEGVELSPWIADYTYYKNKYGLTFEQPRYWKAEIYEEIPNERYGTSSGGGFKYYHVPFLETIRNAITQYIGASRKRKENKITINEQNTNMSLKTTNEITMGNAIGRPSDSKEIFKIIDTIYQGKPCYKLIRMYEGGGIFGKEEEDKFLEQLQNNVFKCETEEEKDKFKKIVYFWKNSKHGGTVERIINKNDYALVYFSLKRHSIKETGQKFITEYTEEFFEKKDKKYQQILYKSNTLRLAKGTGYYNNKNIYTYIVKYPIEQEAYSHDNLKDCPNKIYNSLDMGYELFCTRKDNPTPEMLEEWNKFLGK